MKRIVVGLVALILIVSSVSAGSFRYGNATVTTGTAVLIGNKTGRAALSVCNQDATNDIFCGDSAVTISNGMPVHGKLCSSIGGTTQSGPTTSNKDVYCVAVGGSVDARFWESTL